MTGPRPPLKGGFGGFTTRFDLFKPIIAAVNGWTIGGGCEMVLACDIAIAAENARFGVDAVIIGAEAGGACFISVASQPEIERYLDHLADRLDLRQDITFIRATRPVPAG